MSIDASNTTALLAIMFALIALGHFIDTTRLGKSLSGVIWVIFGAMALSNLGVVPMAAPLYDLIWDLGIPLAVSLLLFHANLVRILGESGRLLIAFVIGAAGAMAGVLVALQFIDLGEHAPALAGMFTGTYIGGSVNFASVADATQFSGQKSLMSAAVAADNIAGTLFLIVLASLPAWAIAKRYFVIASDAVTGEDAELAPVGKRAIIQDLPISLMLAFGIVFVSDVIAEALGIGYLSILFVTAITVALATLLPRQMGARAGAYDFGMMVMYLFFFAIGAGADVGAMLEQGVDLFIFASIIIGVHFAVLLLGGKLFKLEISELVIASNACVLGAATAAAQAGAMGWRALVTPAILVATLGYAGASYLGVMIYELLLP